MKKTTNSAWLNVDYNAEPCVIALKAELKRKDIIKNHPYKKWESTNGRWLSYLPDETKEQGRKLISCKTLQALEDAIVEHYESTYSPTFGEAYREWSTRRLLLKQIAESTYTRNDAIYQKHFKEFERKRLDSITIDDYVDFLERQIADWDMTAKAAANMRGVLIGTLNRAKRLKQIPYSGYDVLNEFKTVNVRYQHHIKDDATEVFDEWETTEVVKYLMEHDTVEDVALLLIFATGLRAGECVALKHGDFGSNYLVVRRTESKYRKDGKQIRIIKEFPKTEAGVRTVVIPPSYQWIVDRIHKINPDGDYCFTAQKGGRLSVQALEKRLNKVCDALNIPRRSPHKIRKTYCTILLDNNVDVNFIKQQVGHSEIMTTEQFYHRNRKNLTKKSEILDAIDDFKIFNQT